MKPSHQKPNCRHPPNLKAVFEVPFICAMSPFVSILVAVNLSFHCRKNVVD